MKVTKIIQLCEKYQKETPNAIFCINIFITELKRIENSNPSYDRQKQAVTMLFLQLYPLEL